MLYRLINTIENVIDFEPCTGYYLMENQVKNVFDIEFTVQLEKVNSIFSFNKDVFILDDLNKPYILKNCKIDNYLTDAFRVGSLKYPFVEYYKKTQPRVYGIYDYSKSNVLFETTQWIGRDIINEYIFGVEKGIITARKLTSAEPLWQFSFENLGTYFDNFHNVKKKYDFSKILGIWESELLVALSEYKIISLDIKTGFIIREWNSIDGLYFDDTIKDSIPSSSSFLLKDDKLIGGVHKFYIEIDLKTGLTHFVDLSKELEKNNVLSIYPVLGNPIIENRLFFTAMMKEKQNNSKWAYECILVLNLLNYKIEWVYAFEKAGLGNNRPKLSEGKLYQLDINNTLHIFQE